MNTLLFFFAFPVAVIIFSIVLEKLLKNPIIVSSLIFAVFLILTFAVFDTNFLIATFAYTVLSFITALIVHLLDDRDDRRSRICNLLSSLLENTNNDNNDNICDTVEDLLGNNTSNQNSNTNTNNCGCGCNRFRRK